MLPHFVYLNNEFVIQSVISYNSGICLWLAAPVQKAEGNLAGKKIYIRVPNQPNLI